MPRRRMTSGEEEPDSEGGLYFSDNAYHLEYIPTGCALLDCVVGGGWAEGRIVNIVGDPSTNKTGLCIEACANFLQKHPSGQIWYNETEAAFDVSYAEGLGLPTNDSRLTFSECGTIEELFAHLEECAGEASQDRPGLYIIDSLDAMTDQAETERKITEGSYGTGKAKKLSELFRRLNRALHQSNMTVVFVSQTRENIGVSFGEKYTRSGGKALRFYASQEVWLSNLGKIKKTVRGVERSIGAQLRCQVKKLKVGMPFRTCDLNLIFGYGIDDLASNVYFLEKAGRLDGAGLTEGSTALLRRRPKMSEEELADVTQRVDRAVRQVWPEIEAEFTPKQRKYNL